MNIYYKTPEIQTLFESEDLSEIDYLLRNGLDINSKNVYNQNAAFDASFEKMLFLEKKGINLFHESREGFNLLFNYKKRLTLKKFQYLVDKGLSFEHYNSNGYSILPYLKIDQLEYLEKEYQFELKLRHNNGALILDGVSQPIAEILCSKYKVNPLALNSDGRNSLFNNDKQTMEFLISKGVDYTKKDVYGNTALLSSNIDSFKYLISLGLNPQEIDYQGFNLFAFADYESAKYMVEELGIDPLDEQYGKTLMDWQDLKTLDYLCEKGCMEQYNKTELISCLENNSFTNVDYLLNLDVYKKNNISKEKDIYFKKQEDPEYARRLIAHLFKSGLSINITNENKNNLLHFHDDIFIKEWLLNKGINVNFLNNEMRNILFTDFLSLIKDDVFARKEYEYYKKLIDKGINIYHIDAYGKNTLFRVFNSYIIKDLIEKGVDAKHKENQGIPFWYYINDEHVLPLIKEGCFAISYLNYLKDHLGFLILEIQDKDKDKDKSLFTDEMIKKYIEKTFNFAVKLTKSNLVSLDKETNLMLMVVEKLHELKSYVKKSEAIDYIKKVIRKFIIFCIRDKTVNRMIFTISGYSNFEVIMDDYKVMMILSNKNPMLEYSFLKDKNFNHDTTKILNHINSSKNILKFPLSLKINLLEKIFDADLFKDNCRKNTIKKLKGFFENLISLPLNDYMNNQLLEDYPVIKKILRYIPSNNSNYDALNKLIKKENTEKLINKMNKRMFFYESLSANEKLDFINVYGENILFFITNIENYNICKKYTNLNQISQYGDNALFSLIKEIDSFFKNNRKDKICSDYIDYILKIIDDSKELIENNDVGDNIFEILKDKEDKIEDEKLEYIKIIMCALENKKIKMKIISEKDDRHKIQYRKRI